jgi:integrase
MTSTDRRHTPAEPRGGAAPIGFAPAKPGNRPTRSSKRVPGYRLHKPSGQAVVTLSGRDFYLGRHGAKASRARYEQLVGEWLANGRRLPAKHADEDATVAELLAAYLDWADGHHAPATAASHPHRLRLLRQVYGSSLASEFDQAALRALQRRMIEQGLARNTINDRVAWIKAVFHWGLSQGMVSPDQYLRLKAVPSLRIGRGGRETPPVRPVPDHTIDQTLPHLPPAVADMVRLQRLTGMRPGEVRAMRWSEIDTAGPVWLYSPREHKTARLGRERIIRIGPRAQDILRKYLTTTLNPDRPIFSPEVSEAHRRAEAHAKRKTPLSCGNKPSKRIRRNYSDRYDKDSYARAIERACDKAFPHPNLRPREGESERKFLARLADAQRNELAHWRRAHRWSPNRLRHTAATEIRRQFGLEAAQIVLGHSSALITDAVYAERDHALANKVLAQIG